MRAHTNLGGDVEAFGLTYSSCSSMAHSCPEYMTMNTHSWERAGDRMWYVKFVINKTTLKVVWKNKYSYTWYWKNAYVVIRIAKVLTALNRVSIVVLITYLTVYFFIGFYVWLTVCLNWIQYLKLSCCISFGRGYEFVNIKLIPLSWGHSLSSAKYENCIVLKHNKLLWSSSRTQTKYTNATFDFCKQ